MRNNSIRAEFMVSRHCGPPELHASRAMSMAPRVGDRIVFADRSLAQVVEVRLRLDTYVGFPDEAMRVDVYCAELEPKPPTASGPNQEKGSPP